MKESFTIAKPHVSESFFEKLMSNSDEKDETVTFTRKHLNATVAELGRDVMAREKSNFESYTMYYENLLRALHQNLYQKEQVCSFELHCMQIFLNTLYCIFFCYVT